MDGTAHKGFFSLPDPHPRTQRCFFSSLLLLTWADGSLSVPPVYPMSANCPTPEPLSCLEDPNSMAGWTTTHTLLSRRIWDLTPPAQTPSMELFFELSSLTMSGTAVPWIPAVASLTLLSHLCGPHTCSLLLHLCLINAPYVFCLMHFLLFLQENRINLPGC
jgi:hypothetical protein